MVHTTAEKKGLAGYPRRNGLLFLETNFSETIINLNFLLAVFDKISTSPDFYG
jgi:hypothetical protein